MGFGLPSIDINIDINPIDDIPNAIDTFDDFKDTAVDNTTEFTSTVISSGEDALANTVKFESSLRRFTLEKTFEGLGFVNDKAGDVKDFAGNVKGFTVDKAGDFKDFVVDKGGDAKDFAVDKAKDAANFIDKILRPGDPNPPAAQGLTFSETKSASSLAYGAKKGQVYQFPDGTNPNGKNWEVVDVRDDSKTGFRAIALKPTDPNDNRIIVAYAGTEPTSIEDWKNNIKQGIGIEPAQYEMAVDFADKWKTEAAKTNADVTLAGHSLGGGLASYASIKTDQRATALNSAPLALNHLGGSPLDSTVRNNPKITQYYVPGEVLTYLDEHNKWDVRPGNKIAVQGKYPSNPLPLQLSNLVPAILNHMGGNAAPDIPEPKLVS